MPTSEDRQASQGLDPGRTESILTEIRTAVRAYRLPRLVRARRVAGSV